MLQHAAVTSGTKMMLEKLLGNADMDEVPSLTPRQGYGNSDVISVDVRLLPDMVERALARTHTVS